MSGSDVTFSGGIHLRIRNGGLQGQIIVSEFDVTIGLRAALPSPRLDFFTQPQSTLDVRGVIPSRCIASYLLMDLAHVSHGNTKKGIVMEFRCQAEEATMFLVQLTFLDSEARGKVYEAIVTNRRHFQQVATANSAIRSESDATSIRSLLTSVRALQGKTRSLLNEIRVESDPPGDAVGAEPLNQWALTMLQRRRKLDDAQEELNEIQMRRTMRSTTLGAQAPSSSIPLCTHCYQPTSDPAHEGRCSKRPVRCRECNEVVLARNFKHHRREDCTSRSVQVPRASSLSSTSMRSGTSSRKDQKTQKLTCPHCDKRASHSHVKKCAYRPVECSKCSSTIRAKDASTHRCKKNVLTVPSNKSFSSRFKPRE